jgi:hypothetical protein
LLLVFGVVVPRSAGEVLLLEKLLATLSPDSLPSELSSRVSSRGSQNLLLIAKQAYPEIV